MCSGIETIKCIYFLYTGSQVVTPRALEVVAPTTSLSWFLWKQCLLSPSKYSASYMQCLSQASQHNDMAQTKKVSVPHPTSVSLRSGIWWPVDPGHPQRARLHACFMFSSRFRHFGRLKWQIQVTHLRTLGQKPLGGTDLSLKVRVGTSAETKFFGPTTHPYFSTPPSALPRAPQAQSKWKAGLTPPTSGS